MFDFLFRKGKSVEASPAAVAPPPAPATPEKAAPGTAIRFHPELVAELKHDHQVLLTLFASIQSAFKEGRLQAVVEHLEAFRTSIQSHLLKENVRLYIYLEHQLAGDETSHQLIHDFRHEMDGIGKAVVAFLAKYKDLSVDGNLVASFGRDLEAVGKVLVDRIQREEETLYPLYAPAY
ncbi:MAG: hemerythrin HHE cation-binding protein [Rhodocyclales bacterium]|jgi:iron-sulfur cluster repair protein YtfE (RIC family)|nr:hemerythrin domain-containing protein [Rhodocyclaceae bacterium]PWB39285.1 MAG: hemerythrin HHE cation-binding protein [Rhodocyclales bacterium]